MPKPDSMQEYLTLSDNEKMALFEEDAARGTTPAFDMLLALKDIVACPSIRGPAGTTAYIISDARMQAAKAAIARTQGGSS